MKYVKQFSIILGISFLAELLEILIPLPIAASVYGLVIMLVGLITKLIPLEKVETAADFLVDAMSIMFVPATVGIMASVNALKEMLLPICVITVVSTVLIMIVTGSFCGSVDRERNPCTGETGRGCHDRGTWGRLHRGSVGIQRENGGTGSI